MRLPATNTERAQDALEVKLKAYLEEEMRALEKTFPDELWLEFAGAADELERKRN